MCLRRIGQAACVARAPIGQLECQSHLLCPLCVPHLGVSPGTLPLSLLVCHNVSQARSARSQCPGCLLEGPRRPPQKLRSCGFCFFSGATGEWAEWVPRVSLDWRTNIGVFYFTFLPALLKMTSKYRTLSLPFKEWDKSYIWRFVAATLKESRWYKTQRGTSSRLNSISVGKCCKKINNNNTK